MSETTKPDLTEKPVVPVQTQEIPHSKEDWQKLARENPARFVELSQPKIDELTREKREANEKLLASEQRERNLLVEIERNKKPIIPEEQPIVEKYGDGRYPQTEQEWDELFIERPTFAGDLRNSYLNKNRAIVEDFNMARQNSAKTVQSEHPDMYIIELDETGKPKTDGQGKSILKVDPNTNTPIFNPESEKGKLWVEIWNEDAKGWSSLRNAPKLMMAEMERRLRVKGANMVNQAQNNSVDNDQSGLAPKGVTPPKGKSLKFDSDEERALAEKAVGRGTYKSLEDYVNWRDGGTKNFDHGNSRPDFSRK